MVCTSIPREHMEIDYEYRDYIERTYTSKKASSKKFSLFIRYCLQHFSNFILCLQRVKTSSKFYHYVLLRQKRRRRPPITRDFCRLSLFCAACRKMNRPAIVPLCTPTWCAATSTTLFSKRSFLVQIKVVIDKN